MATLAQLQQDIVNAQANLDYWRNFGHPYRESQAAGSLQAAQSALTEAQKQIARPELYTGTPEQRYAAMTQAEKNELAVNSINTINNASVDTGQNRSSRDFQAAQEAANAVMADPIAKLALADPVAQQYVASQSGSGGLGGLVDFASGFVKDAGLLTHALPVLGAGMLMGAGGLLGAGSAGGAGTAGTAAGTIGTAGEALSVNQIASLAGNPAAFGAYQSAGMIPAGMTMGAGGAILTSAGTPLVGASAGGGLLGGVGQQAAQTAAGQVLQGGAAPAFDITNPATYPWGDIASTALTGVGGLMQGQAATDAARTAADAQIRAAQIAADAAKFRPVGVTTGFGTSQFGYDPQGNLISAGYQLTPEMQAQQRSLMGISGQALGQYGQAMGATAPLGAGAQQAMALGQGYLGTSPQAQAAQYMAEQQALLAPARDRERAALEARQAAMGTGGLMVGGINPREFSRQQALAEQDLALAAQATQGGMDYAKFGAGMMGAGGDLLKQMYGTQQAAYAPYQTALGGAAYVEGLGQQAMDFGTAIGAKTSTAGAQAGLLQARGLEGAAQTQLQTAQQVGSPWGNLLQGAGTGIQNYQAQQQQQQQQALNNQLMQSLMAKNWQTGGTTV